MPNQSTISAMSSDSALLTWCGLTSPDQRISKRFVASRKYPFETATRVAQSPSPSWIRPPGSVHSPSFRSTERSAFSSGMPRTVAFATDSFARNSSSARSASMGPVSHSRRSGKSAAPSSSASTRSRMPGGQNASRPEGGIVLTTEARTMPLRESYQPDALARPPPLRNCQSGTRSTPSSHSAANTKPSKSVPSPSPPALSTRRTAARFDSGCARYTTNEKSADGGSRKRTALSFSTVSRTTSGMASIASSARERGLTAGASSSSRSFASEGAK